MKRDALMRTHAGLTLTDSRVSEEILIQAVSLPLIP